MDVIFQRLKGCNGRKQSRDETHRLAESHQHPLLTTSSPLIAPPGPEEHMRLRDQLVATAQECPPCPRNAPLPLQHFLAAGQGTAACCPGSTSAPSPSTHSTALTHHCRFHSAFPHFVPGSAAQPALGKRALVRPPLPNMLPGAQTAAQPAQLLPLLCRRQGWCLRRDLSTAPVGAASTGRLYLGAAGLRLAARAGPKEGPGGWAH